MENINFLGVSGVAFIVIICWMIGLVIKATSLDSKWIPVVCGIGGAILGVLAFRFGADGFPATDYFQAVAIGIVSGLGSVGCHQIYKQLTQAPEEDYKKMYESAEMDVMILKSKLDSMQAKLDMWQASTQGHEEKEE